MTTEQTMTGRRPGAMGAQPYRHGQMQHIAYRTWKSAAGTNPPTELDGVRLLEFKRCQWAFKMPAGCTSYQVSFYRLVGSVKYNGDTPTVISALVWIHDETITATESSTNMQDVNGDELGCAIHHVVGGPSAADFEVLYKGVSS